MTDEDTGPVWYGNNADPGAGHTGPWPPSSWPAAPAYSHPPTPPRVPVGFGTALASGFRQCVRGEGRASRREFWYFFLFYGVVLLGVGYSEGALKSDWSDILGTVVYLSLLIPFVAVGVRRLYDTGRSGGWCWMLPSLVGFVVLVIFWSEPSQPDANRYGP